MPFAAAAELLYFFVAREHPCGAVHGIVHPVPSWLILEDVVRKNCAKKDKYAKTHFNRYKLESLVVCLVDGVCPCVFWLQDSRIVTLISRPIRSFEL